MAAALKPKPADAPESQAVDVGHARLLTGNLALMMALEANGLDKKADELGVKVEAGIARHARLARDPPPKPTDEPIALPDRERGLGANEVRQWERARETLKNLPSNASDERKKAYAKTMRDVEDRPAAKADDAWRDQANAETVALAEARGEEVEISKAGRVNITTRDSLLSLIKSGKLTDAQAQAGKTCRDAYELRSQSLGAMNYSDTGRGGRDHEASIAWGIAKANASMMLPFVERFIQLRHISNPVALTMFRNILCERHTIADHGTSQSVRERNTAAFILALDAAVDGIESWARTRGGR